MSNWFEWPFAKVNSEAVAGWGFWLNVVGLLLTTIGFILAFRQLKKTLNAADAAKQEAVRIRDAMNRFEIGNEAVRASSALLTARNYARNELWVHAATSYEVVHDSLLVLSDSDEIFGAELLTKMNKACVYIKKFCARVEGDRLAQTQTINPAKTISVMSDHRAMLAEISRLVAKDMFNDN